MRCPIRTVPNSNSEYLISFYVFGHLVSGRYRHGILEVFDSLGKAADLINDIGVNIAVRFNETQLQSDESKSCGEFVLYFIFSRLHNFDLDIEEYLKENM